MARANNNAANVAAGGKKRALIAQAEKNMFVWLSVSAVIVSVCLVAAQFLVREAMFNQQVINKKSTTKRQLETNIANVKTLQSSIDKLITDKGLVAVGQQDQAATDKSSNLKVILDALPVDGDSTAFNNSLQKVILPRSGVSIGEIGAVAEPVATDAAGEASASSSAAPSPLPFKITVGGDYEKITKMFADFTHVIRPIDVTSLSIRSGDNNVLLVDISGNTYFSPMKTVEVKTVECKQGGKC